MGKNSRKKVILKQKYTRKNNKKIKILSKKEFASYNKLSPFELKDTLMKLAKGNNPNLMLNAGRGNPNFLNSFCRELFSLQNTLCVNLTNSFKHDLVVYPSVDEKNYELKLRKGCEKWPTKYREFFLDYLHYLKKEAINKKLNVNGVFHDLILSTLGCFYPVPAQIQQHVDLVAENFMFNLVLNRKDAVSDNLPGTKMKPSDYEFFATEGAAAGILYVFNTLKANYILNPGDHIAIITPIFSPYLEMPILEDPQGYGLKIIRLKGKAENNYSLSDEEINKLKDKKIKALFMVNPTNPGEYSLSKENITKIGKIVNSERKDLVVLSDNVYAPFAEEYYSFMMSCPRNTIEVFSCSKYFGTTGWRLGICMVAKDNNITKIIQNISSEKTKALSKRYSTISREPHKLTFMERLVNDSRQVAEGHVAGLSTPQQSLMSLFMYYDMHDRNKTYKHEIKSELKKRMHSLYEQLNSDPHMSPLATDYYKLLHIPTITKNLYGEKASNYLVNKYEYLEFLFHLAKVYHVVLLPGLGFGADAWRVRVSLANLDNQSYKKISLAVKNCIYDFVKSEL